MIIILCCLTVGGFGHSGFTATLMPPASFHAFMCTIECMTLCLCVMHVTLESLYSCLQFYHP